jgi:glucokinase
VTLLKDEILVLAGDVGGTKTNLGLFQMGKTRPSPKMIETYFSKEVPNLEHIIGRFLDKHKAKIAGACFGVAGPVQGGRSKITNLPWTISENRIKKRFKWNHVTLVNDLTATAYALPLLTNRELHALNKAKGGKGQNLGLVAPGTGLGMALSIWMEDKYIPVASEGGHADFGPNDLMQEELWAYLYERWDHVSVERVLSGSGLFNIYAWLRDSGRLIEPAWLAKKIQEMDPARAISEAAMDRKDPLCEEALDIFVSIFGAVVGNLALTGMTTGGVYLGGGIPPKILPKLEDDTFIQAFTNKGRFKHLMDKIPVRVILNDRAALLGAAHCAFEVQKTKRSKSS